MGLIEKWNDPFHAEVVFFCTSRWCRELSHLLGGDDALKQYEAMIRRLVIVGIASRWRYTLSMFKIAHEKCLKSSFPRIIFSGACTSPGPHGLRSEPQVGKLGE